MRITRQLAAALCTLAIAATLGAGLHGYVTFGRWSETPVYFYANPANGDVSEASATAALELALNEWTNHSGSSLRYVYGGRVNDTSTGYDRRNVMLFRNAANPSGTGIIATTYWWKSGDTIVDADIVFWDGAWAFFAGTSGCSDGAYIEDVAVHELGHALGLNHSSVADASMYAGYSRCSQTLRSIAADDIAGAQALYGSGRQETNTAPTVLIASPASGSTAAPGALLSFSGSASDSQEGNISAGLAWSSNIDGALGSGASFSRGLSSGLHTITARVTDAGGLSASRQITLTVSSPSSTGPVLHVRGYKTKGAPKADLSWTALSAAQVDIYRNGTRVSQSANDGLHTDAIAQKGAGTYTYRVCATGTTTCSNDAAVKF